MEAFIGEIRMFAGNFAPRDWEFCEGQLLQIADNPTLFSLLGTTYGGNGVTTFALPDLRGRVPIGAGQGPGLTQRLQGHQGGAEHVPLDIKHIPQHAHEITNTVTADPSTLNVTGTAKMKCNTNAGDRQYPEGSVHAATSARGGDTIYSASGQNFMNEDCIDLDLQATGNVNVVVTSTCNHVGDGFDHHNMQPWLCINYIIATQGEYPPRH